MMDERDAGPKAINEELGIAQPVVVGQCSRPCGGVTRLPLLNGLYLLRLYYVIRFLIMIGGSCPTMKPLYFVRTGFSMGSVAPRTNKN